MKEEAKLDILLSLLFYQFSEKNGKQHQVVVVDPDKVPVFNIIGDGFCEEIVGFAVRFPRLFVKRDFARVVVE